MQITGHRLILPLTTATMDHARIVLIVRQELEVSIQREFMDPETATIFVKIGNTKNNSITLVGIYREHQQLGRTDPAATQMEIIRDQEIRWRRIVKKWKSAGNKGKCVIVGDINLDYNRWEEPEQHQIHMVDLTKDKIENDGFSQLVTGVTRIWKDQTESLLDHIWVNCPPKGS